ncbi:toll/interleukin-1 receptor domain-containing protein [Accumulibacter sp.]|uniref:toll/interleukin-1 receptor domain-containing protein n=1 Tax=Accumulibacter sp. TaxID=2053492 RepID=UPI001AC0B0B4|nr:toll/interleukin-1 receptor domain-containing protein [Accumulibacter sp.]MBN8455325.1 toll/interleukin-1 receptor domain-containing protein [Accumulibacter sp.]MBO3708593.1 toll/interleukin-1 receptor domain-containing protein [Candidatus Accumulibacter conexus]
MVSVYVSYAWKEEAQKRLVDKLEQACAARGIKLRRDRTSIGYGDSIRKFMDEIGAAGHVVVVLSEAYFRSPSCMYELRQIYENRGFRKRVNPIVLSGTRFHDPIDRLSCIEYWTAKTVELEQALKRQQDPKHTLKIRGILDHYDKCRMLMDELLDLLTDMNTLAEDVHLATDFTALLDRIAPRTEADGAPADSREADELFVRRVENEVRQTLAAVPELARMVRHHAGKMGLPVGDHLARGLCTGKLEVVLDDVLRPATHDALPRQTRQAIRDSDTWEAAKSLLFWLSVLAVRPDWVKAQEEKERCGESRFEVFVHTSGGAEIVSSRYRQVRPGFKASGGLDVKGAGEIELSNLESGWNDDQAIEGILLDVANHLSSERYVGPALETTDIEFIKDALAYDQKHKAGHHYILVAPGDDSPLKRPQVYSRLSRLLPGLRILYLKSAGDETPLLVDRETRLITIIRGFLTLPDSP